MSALSTPARGARAVIEYLEGQEVAYSIVEHRPTATATAEARAAHLSPERTAKTVVVRAGDRTVLAVVQASRLLDLGRLGEALGTTAPLRLATEDEIADRFPDADVGAIPPVGALAAVAVVDHRLLQYDAVLAHAGDHRHGVLLRPADLVRLADARVADIALPWAPVI